MKSLIEAVKFLLAAHAEQTPNAASGTLANEHLAAIEAEVTALEAAPAPTGKK